MNRILSGVFILINLFLLAPIVSAQGLKNAGSKLDTAAQKSGTKDTGSLDSIVGTGIRTVLTLVGLIFLILMVYAGFLWMTARGDEAKIDKAKEIISAAIIGLVVVLGAYAITALVIGRFGS